MALAKVEGLESWKRNRYADVKTNGQRQKGASVKVDTLGRSLYSWRSAPLLSNSPRLSMVGGRKGGNISSLIEQRTRISILRYHVSAKVWTMAR